MVQPAEQGVRGDATGGLRGSGLRRGLGLLLRLAISVGLLGVLLAKVGTAMLHAASGIGFGYVLAAVAVSLLGVVVGAWKWWLMLGRLGVTVLLLDRVVLQQLPAHRDGRRCGAGTSVAG